MKQRGHILAEVVAVAVIIAIVIGGALCVSTLLKRSKPTYNEVTRQRAEERVAAKPAREADKALEAAAIAEVFPIRFGDLVQKIETDDVTVKLFLNFGDIDNPYHLPYDVSVTSRRVPLKAVVVSKFPVVGYYPLAVRTSNGEVRLADCPLPVYTVEIKAPSGYEWLLPAEVTKTLYYDGTALNPEHPPFNKPTPSP
jgi:hypothetical protein